MPSGDVRDRLGHRPAWSSLEEDSVQPYMGPSPSQWSRSAANLRASHADRAEVVERIKTAFAEGRLDAAELDERLHAAMTARTHADLAPLLADLSPPAHPTVPSTPGRVTGSDRMWGMSSHALGFFTWFVGPLVVMLTRGGTSAFVRDQAVEALNFQLTFLLAQIGMIFVAVFTLGIGALLYIPLVMAWLVLMGIGAVSALAGARYRYPFNLRVVR